MKGMISVRVASILEALSAQAIRKQISYLPQIAAWMLLPFILVMFAFFQDSVPMGELTREPIIVARNAEACCSVFSGTLSNLGAVMWLMCGAILIFSSVALSLQRSIRNMAFLGTAGAINLMLGIDDMLLLHDEVIPVILGVPEKAVLLFYMIIVGTFLVVFLKEILESRYIAFAIAIALFIIALGEDLFRFAGYDNFHYLIEDGLRIIGLGSWLYFFVFAALNRLNPEYETAANP